MKTNNDSMGVTAADRWISLLLVLLMLLAAGLGLDNRLNWGDDFAAYISYGIAIAEGTVEEQAERNFTLHPTQLPAEADGRLYYVWGVPLLLACVYRAVGFDRTDYHSVVYYKLPSLLALSLAAGVLYLFFRRRFSRPASVFMALSICGSNHILTRLNLYIGTDIPFFFLSVCVFLIHELFLEQKRGRGRWFWGILLGLFLWYCCETRLNGAVYLPFLLLSHFASLYRSGAFREKWTVSRILTHCAPYLVFLFLWCVSPVLLPNATSNASDYSRFRLRNFILHCLYYGNQTCIWLAHFLLRPEASFFPGRIYTLLGAPILLAAGYGLLRHGFGANIGYSLLLIGSVIGTSALPYSVWNLRYLLNILPIICMYAAYGLRDLWIWFRRKRPGVEIPRRLRPVLLLLLTLWPLSLAIQTIGRGYGAPEDPALVYDPDSVQVWQYIQEETPEDCRIFFRKPRCLFLNTNRMSFTGTNQHDPMDADYVLAHAPYPPDEETAALLEDRFTPVFENGSFTLYQKNP